jgi:hypothetical protein
MPYLKAPPIMAASTMSPLNCHIVCMGAPALIASIARRSSHGITLVSAPEATTISSPNENVIQYGL